MKLDRRSPSKVALLLAVLLLAPGARVWARKQPKLKEPPPLTQTYTHRDGLFSFVVPEGWKIGKGISGDPDAVQATGDGLVVRFIYRRGEAGYDAYHGTCLAERLIGRGDASGMPDYEYDYVEGSYGDRRSIDSAFVSDYDTEVFGHRRWRQRNLTVVGGGHSLCMIAFAPASVWKRSIEARSLLDAVLQNVKFQE
jgi:hypothetical protein